MCVALLIILPLRWDRIVEHHIHGARDRLCCFLPPVSASSVEMMEWCVHFAVCVSPVRDVDVDSLKVFGDGSIHYPPFADTCGLRTAVHLRTQLVSCLGTDT